MKETEQTVRDCTECDIERLYDRTGTLVCDEKCEEKESTEKIIYEWDSSLPIFENVKRMMKERVFVECIDLKQYYEDLWFLIGWIKDNSLDRLKTYKKQYSEVKNRAKEMNEKYINEVNKNAIKQK